jgi:hypothetical protein
MTLDEIVDQNTAPDETPPDPSVVQEDSSLRPDEWAVKKGLIVLGKDRSIDYRKVVPWKFNCMKMLSKWPNPAADPDFKITEEEFEKALASVKDI